MMSAEEKAKLAVLSCLLLAVAPACSDDTQPMAEDTETGDGDPGDGDPTGDGDGDPTGDGDGDPTGDGDGDGDGDPNMAPPGYVDFGGGYIAETEVTVLEYDMFVNSNPGFNNLPAECSWKNDYTPLDWNGQLMEDASFPVRGIDWCDAWAYCDFAGARLCGEIGGGPALLDDYDDATVNEWFRACSDVGTLIYPYGNLYQDMDCNGMDSGISDYTAVGTLQTCEGGIPGLYDMSGNVWEWTNSCDNQQVADEDQECRQRGGSRFSAENNLRCAINSLRARNFRNNGLGTRCCLDY